MKLNAAWAWALLPAVAAQEQDRVGARRAALLRPHVQADD